MKKPSEQPNAVHVRLRSWMFNSSFMTDPTPPYALYALVHLPLAAMPALPPPLCACSCLMYARSARLLDLLYPYTYYRFVFH